MKMRESALTVCENDVVRFDGPVMKEADFSNS